MTPAVNTRTVIRFSRFSQKGYAAFVSMHKEVIIGTLCSRICDCQLLKSHMANRFLRIEENVEAALMQKESSQQRESQLLILNLLADEVSSDYSCALQLKLS